MATRSAMTMRSVILLVAVISTLLFGVIAFADQSVQTLDPNMNEIFERLFKTIEAVGLLLITFIAKRQTKSDRIQIEMEKNLAVILDWRTRHEEEEEVYRERTEKILNRIQDGHS